MTTFLLIRHAAHELVGRALVGRTPGVHLSEEGQGQAERLTERLSALPVAAVYSSPLERARETAAPLARRLGREIVTSGAFNELDFGAWTGRTLDELEEEPHWRFFNTFRSGTRPPGGESMPEAQTRIVTELARLREQFPDEHVAVFSHADLIKAAVAFYLGVHLDLFQRIEISPASVSTVTLEGWGPRVLQVNGAGELPR